MVIPVGTDQYSWRTPVATLALITVNVLAYAAVLLVERKLGTRALTDLLATTGLSWQKFQLWQPITYQFVHDPNTIMHLGGNMLFLWIFGTAVEGRLRWWGFTALYLIGGVAAGMAQLWGTHGVGAVIGASGAVSAVTGAFVVFFPRARVSVFMFMSTMPMPAMLLVGLYLVLDLLGVIGLSNGGVAYMAHVGGLGFGVGISLLLLGTGMVRRTDMDMLYLLKQARRRAEMRQATAQARGSAPWHKGSVPERVASAPIVEPAPNGVRSPNVRLAARLVEEASAAYAGGDFERAAAAYQRALEAAPSAPDADQTRLMLAVIFGRKLKQHGRARELLRSIGEGLPENLRDLAATLRVEVQA